MLTSISTLKEQAEERLVQTASESQKSLEDMRNSTQQQIKQVSDSALSDLKTTVSELKVVDGGFFERAQEFDPTGWSGNQKCWTRS